MQDQNENASGAGTPEARAAAYSQKAIRAARESIADSRRAQVHSDKAKAFAAQADKILSQVEDLHGR